MPWKETCPMSERLNFINDWLSKRGCVGGLCEAYGITRETGHKWIRRFKANGKSGLEDNSRAPLNHPNATDEAMVALVIAARRAHPTWGPIKLRRWLEDRHFGLVLPAASTMGDILKRAGLVKPRKRGRRLQGGQGNLADYGESNSVWCIDYKGQFRLGDGSMCYPLTVTDGFSRMILCCEGHIGPRYADARRSLEQVFKEYGLPGAIRSDNGIPFASTGAARLTLLSVWWLKLGIELQRIRPGKPQENGRHERMHRTLKAETARPPQADMRRQQRRFDGWLKEYNYERPHAALGGATPASKFELSLREYQDEACDPEYPGHFEKRRVRREGLIKIKGVQVYLSQALGNELVGLVEIEDGQWRLKFGSLELGIYDERTGELRPIGSSRGVSQGKKYKKKVSGMCPV
jgi:transposase InsO family protein